MFYPIETFVGVHLDNCWIPIHDSHIGQFHAQSLD